MTSDPPPDQDREDSGPSVRPDGGGGAGQGGGSRRSGAAAVAPRDLPPAVPSPASRSASAPGAFRSAAAKMASFVRREPRGTSSDTERLLDPEAGEDGASRRHSSNSMASSCAAGGKHKQQIVSDFVFIKIVARLALSVLRRFWHVSSVAILAIILLYWLCGGFLAFLLVVFAVTGILYHAEDRLLYHPDMPPTSRVFVPAPSVVGLPFESVYLTSKDKTRLHAFLIKQPPEKQTEAPTLLFFHGNAGNIGHRLLNMQGLYSNLSCNIFMLEYRGFGHSDGSPSEDGLYMDAQAALDYLSNRSDINPSRIVVFGRSLGGAVAVEVAARPENRDKMACLVVENTFTSIPAIARALFDFRLVRCMPNWCHKNVFNSRWKICHVSSPVLFLSGLQDNLVPPKMMDELFVACGSEHKRMAKFPQGTHNETWSCQHYYHALRYFLEEVAKVKDGGAASGPVSASGAAMRAVTSPPPGIFTDQASGTMVTI